MTAYADAANSSAQPLSLRLGVIGDLVHELAELGKRWDRRGVAWAATGFAAASALAPYLTEVTGIDVFIDAPTPATLDAIADQSDLEPMEGGRLVLRPFPTPVTQRLSTPAGDLRVAARGRASCGLARIWCTR